MLHRWVAGLLAELRPSLLKYRMELGWQAQRVVSEDRDEYAGWSLMACEDGA